MKIETPDFEERKKTPHNLQEAIDILIVNTSLEDIEYIKSLTEDKFLAVSHSFTGRGIRNAWNLWWRKDCIGKYENYPKEIPPIVKYFREQGIYHADDMSGIILTSLFRTLMGMEIDLEGQIAKYQNHWREQNVDFTQDKGL